jgi:hypothetical protein
MSNRPNWTRLHASVHQTLRQRHLLAQQGRILIAVSGGQDSLCLAKLLLDLQPKWGWQMAIAHCDHRWPKDEGLATHVETNWLTTGRFLFISKLLLRSVPVRRRHDDGDIKSCSNWLKQRAIRTLLQVTRGAIARKPSSTI